MATFTALYDSCVLYSAPLRDLLMELALTDLFRAKWSSMIHDEWMRSVLKDRPDISPDTLRRTCELMDMHVRDCLVENFEDLIPSLDLPDTGDRHVLAAAIRGRADVIVTYNLKDFPDKDLHKYGIQAQHPDEFLTHLLDLSAGTVIAAARAHRRRLTNPPKTAVQYLEVLERQALNQFVAGLRAFSALL